MTFEIESARFLTDKAAVLKYNKMPFTKEASKAKLQKQLPVVHIKLFKYSEEWATCPISRLNDIIEMRGIQRSMRALAR